MFSTYMEYTLSSLNTEINLNILLYILILNTNSSSKQTHSFWIYCCTFWIISTGRLTVDDVVDPQFLSNEPSEHGIHRFPLKMSLRPMPCDSFMKFILTWGYAEFWFKLNKLLFYSFLLEEITISESYKYTRQKNKWSNVSHC